VIGASTLVDCQVPARSKERKEKPAETEEAGSCAPASIAPSADSSFPGSEALYLERIREILEDVLDRRLEILLEELLARITPHRSGKGVEDRMITEAELARILQCDPRTVRRLEIAGHIPRALRFGGSKRWRLRSILSWINEMEKKVEMRGTMT